MKFIGHILQSAVICCLVLGLIGCDAFVRKFTRKPKKDNLVQQEVVLYPQEYKSGLTKEQEYRQYFLYWKSWQDELIESLSNTTTPNYKRQVACVEQALKNLLQLRLLLAESVQQKLDKYIKQMNELKASIIDDPYGSQIWVNRSAAERLRSDIFNNFSYNNIKDDLV